MMGEPTGGLACWLRQLATSVAYVMITSTTPTTVFIGFAQVEGGATPLRLKDSSLMAAFSDRNDLVLFAATHNTRVQEVEIASSRLAGLDFVLDPR